MKALQSIVILLAILLLAACSQPLTAELPPPQQLVTVALTPALRPLGPAIQTCADADGEIALLLQEVSAPFLEPEQVDLALRIGEMDEMPPFAAPLAEEQVLVIANEGNPIRHLSKGDVLGIFSGRISSWSELGGENQPVQVWVYPTGDELRGYFDRAALDGARLTSHAMLAPDPASMLEAVGADPGAVGYLPRAWLDESVRVLEIDAELVGELRGPVLALASGEPAGEARNLLYCLQSESGQQAIERLYGKWTNPGP